MAGETEKDGDNARSGSPTGDRRRRRSRSGTAPDDQVITEAALQVARACRRKAKELDEAFLKHADPRAVQGGAICEEAEAWRGFEAQAYRLAFLIEEQE